MGSAYLPGELISAQFQAVVMNIQCYNSCLEIIDYDISKMASKSRKKAMSFIERIIASCYHFLAKMISKKMVYQEILFEHLDKFEQHLKSGDNFPVHLLIRELFRNNKLKLQVLKEDYSDIYLQLIENIETSP